MSTVKILEDDDINLIKEEQSIKESITSTEKIPNEYIPISLVTGGKFTAPTVIYARSFSIDDIISLSVSNDIFKLKNLIKVLQNMIWDPQNKISIGLWTEEQVSEFLLKLYANFYSTTRDQLIFPVKEEDEEYMKQHNEELYKNYLNKTYVPSFSIDIRNLEIDPLPKNMPDEIVITHNGDTFYFRIPRISDTIAIDSIYQKKFYSSDLKFKALQKKIELEQFDSITIDSYNFLNEYPTEKALFLIKITKLFMIEKIEKGTGEFIDFSNLSIDNKIEMLSNMPIPPSVFSEYKEKLSSFNYGINPNITVINPITGKECTRRFSFRPLNVVSFILLSIDNAVLE